MAGNWRKWALAAIVAVIVVYAWIDGGREDLRQVTIPVAVKGGAA
jgi:putative cell wall-binding protein